MDATVSWRWFRWVVGVALSWGMGCGVGLAAGVVADGFGGRGMLVYVPGRLPPAGQRALVIVLHGGLGNAQRIVDGRSEAGMNMNAAAEQSGFVVAYLDGTPVMRRLGPDKLGWNAGGGCCGVPAEMGVDDVGYIGAAVQDLAGKYGIDRTRVFGVGHSNGAMMVQRLMCETTLLAAGVAISGPLNLPGANCPGARGRRILALHGANDANVPVAGGRGTRGLSNIPFNSEERSRQVFMASGGTYVLRVVEGADHFLPSIDAGLQRGGGQGIAGVAVGFFGLGGR